MYQTPSQIWKPRKRTPSVNGHDRAATITAAHMTRETSQGSTTARHGNRSRSAETARVTGAGATWVSALVTTAGVAIRSRIVRGLVRDAGAPDALGTVDACAGAGSWVRSRSSARARWVRSAPPARPRARDGPLDASEAVVAPPLTPVTRTLAQVDGCRVLLDAGNGDCTVVRTAHGALVVTVEPGHRLQKVLASRPWTVRVYRPAPGVPDGWEVALETRPDGAEPGPIYAGVTAKAVDVTEDGRDELVLGYRAEGTGMIPA